MSNANNSSSKYIGATFCHPDYQIGCGGTEEPIVWGGKTFLYVWNKVEKVHEYYVFDDDIFISDRQAPWNLLNF